MAYPLPSLALCWPTLGRPPQSYLSPLYRAHSQLLYLPARVRIILFPGPLQCGVGSAMYLVPSCTRRLTILPTHAMHISCLVSHCLGRPIQNTRKASFCMPWFCMRRFCSRQPVLIIACAILLRRAQSGKNGMQTASNAGYNIRSCPSTSSICALSARHVLELYENKHV
ncbi:hypothetical protein BC628DRAFT_101640 [Trametes gibbosa]|nr:hypothetical protein BC628DRAFT_674573 [Trametes gibbosa]KAI0828213.1 hypothetical protein BC628DRAFT_101640 [Trametes gibbosa]